MEFVEFDLPGKLQTAPKKQHEKNPLFIYHFTQAEEYKISKNIIIAKNKIDETISNFINYNCELK